MAPTIYFFNILIHFFKYKTIEIHARGFLPLIIAAVGSVNNDLRSIFSNFYYWPGGSVELI